MELGTEFFYLCQPGNHAVGDMVRLQRAQAHPGNAGGTVANGNSVQQVKILPLAVGGQVDAYQYDLFNAVGSQVLPFSRSAGALERTRPLDLGIMQ